MYELRHRPATAGIRFGTFNFRALEAIACGRFVECPKLVTLARHTDLEEETPIHCYGWRTRKKTDFQVPKQKLIDRYTPEGIRFILIKVISEHGLPYWLVVCEPNRYGFLVQGHTINRFGKVVSLQRGKRRVWHLPVPKTRLRTR
jgi:hypothetical protein